MTTEEITLGLGDSSLTGCVVGLGKNDAVSNYNGLADIITLKFNFRFRPVPVFGGNDFRNAWWTIFPNLLFLFPRFARYLFILR